MNERRQQKLQALLLRTMSEVLQKSGNGIFGKAMVTVTSTWISPDLSVSRFFVSIFNADKPEEVMKVLEDRTPELRNLLGKELRHHLRIIPEIKFVLDDSAEKAFRIDDILKKS